MGNYTNEDLIFGLDIGTRTIIGIVGYKENNQFIILACESIEHEERAMVDGQIHDIQKVSQTVYQIKTALEKSLNVQLKEVAIAAAGRALNTQIVSVENTYEEIQEFTSTDVHNLELYGVEKAKEEQEKLSANMDYYCVAYSVINYYLNGYIMSQLEGHKGTAISAKIIATFLPKLVIDSLYAVTERVGLQVTHLTLEPIAAINAVIPEQLRLLNLALVDIGAGTSDIAITKAGSVVAYGMIPIAGDELTEAIVHRYLVDFHTAEKIKKQLNCSKEIIFEDILGISHQVSVEEIQQMLEPILDTLTKSIAQKILELNGDNPPNAVFCVGGGSQMLGFVQQLAEYLNLPEERVAVRMPQQVPNIKGLLSNMEGPQMITPIGICITSMKKRYNNITTVTLNEKKVQLLNAKKLIVLDAIVALGIEHTSIFPPKGKTLMFKLNGERQRIKGEVGTPAEIILNNQRCTINDHIIDGDIIQVKKAVCGKNGSASISQYINSSFEIIVNDEYLTLPIVLVNNDYVPLDYCIQENDEVEIIESSKLRDLLEFIRIDAYNKIFKVNDKIVDISYLLKSGDRVHFYDSEQVVDKKILAETPIHETLEKSSVVKEDQLCITVNQEVISLPVRKTPYILASIFDYLDFDLTKPQGTIQLVRNGEDAALTDHLQDGDILKIYWKK